MWYLSWLESRINSLISSIKKTNLCVLVEEGHIFSGICSELGFTLAQHCFDYLDAPIERVCQMETPLPYSKVLERETIPNTDRIVEAIRKVLA